MLYDRGRLHWKGLNICLQVRDEANAANSENKRIGPTVCQTLATCLYDLLSALNSGMFGWFFKVSTLFDLLTNSNRYKTKRRHLISWLFSLMFYESKKKTYFYDGKNTEQSVLPGRVLSWGNEFIETYTGTVRYKCERAAISEQDLSNDRKDILVVICNGGRKAVSTQRKEMLWIGVIELCLCFFTGSNGKEWTPPPPLWKQWKKCKRN